METVNKKINSQVIRLRREDGGEDRVHLFLDANGFLEGANNLEKLASWTKRPSILHQVPGLSKVLDASGNIKVQMDEATKKNLRFFSQGVPCWFEGCEKLREEYATEKATMEEDPNCSDCALGTLTRKYLKKILDAQTAGHP